MNIRKAIIDGALLIMQLHERCVLELCRDDYTPEQLKDWLSSSNLERNKIRLERHRAYLAEKDGKLIGYVRWNPETNELCSIFVDPDFVRQGVATKLMEVAVQDAKEMGVKEFWLDASLTAVPFYEAMGWNYIEQSRHGTLECVKMTKQLHHGKMKNK
jgi:putative acetyltransferase